MHRVRALSSAQSLLSTAVRCTQRTRLAAPRSQTHLRRSLTRTPVAMSGEPAAAAGDAGAVYDSLDIRVGKINKAWKHPEADKLYVEEVDVGEAEARQICSGLVGYVQEKELQGRLVVVLCNLKARNMVGVKSFGMLMAASDAGHTSVELLSPPADAKIGERIRFGDAPQTGPDSENKVQKKKIWEAVQPELRTTAEGVASYKDLPMLTSAGPVKVQRILNGHIS